MGRGSEEILILIVVYQLGIMDVDVNVGWRDHEFMSYCGKSWCVTLVATVKTVHSFGSMRN